MITRISGGSWGAAFLGKPRDFQETLGSLWFRIRGKSVTNRHRVSDGANTELVSTANSNPQKYLYFQLWPCTPQPTEGDKLNNKSQHECQAWKIYRRLWHDLGAVRAFKKGCPSHWVSSPNSAQTQPKPSSLFPKVLKQPGISEVFRCWAHLDFSASILKTGFGGKIPQM